MGFFSNLYKKVTNALPELGRLNSWPAAMIDRIYLNKPVSFLGKAWDVVKTRAIYAALFTPLSVVDLATSALLGMRYAFGSFFTTDQLQTERLEQQRKYATIFSKNLYSLLALPFGLIYPKLTTFYFTPDKTKEGVVAGGNYYQAKEAVLAKPKNEEELKSLVKEAVKAGQKIMPVGAGRSQGKQFLPEGNAKQLVIDLEQFNTIQINADEKTATVGAGVRWIDLQLEADKHKLALKVMQASNIFSVGGSIGTNIHGWDHQTGMLSNAILEMDVINADGEKVTLTPSNELFHHVTGGLGLFGIVTRAKLQLRDNELLIEEGVDVPLHEYVDYFNDEVQNDKNIRMHLYRLSLDPNNLLMEGVAVNYVYQTGPVRTDTLVPESTYGTRFNQVMINVARRFGWIRKFYWESERDRLLKNEETPQTTNAIMQPPINAMFNSSVSEAEWLQEYFLPGEKLRDFLFNLSAILKYNQVILLNASVRFVKQNHMPTFSYAKEGDRFAVVLCFNQSLQPEEVIKAKKWLREAQKLALAYGGTYYLPYQQVSSLEMFIDAYPRARDVKELKLAVDKSETFSSGFYQKYFVGERRFNYFEYIMKDTTRRNLFSGFLENVLMRVETGKFYNLLDDIMKYNDSHEEIYKELCERLPEIMPSSIESLSRILNSLKRIKHDLGKQAVALLKDVKTIDGLVEIGYPGRFIQGFQENFTVTGKIVAVYEEPSITDYIQTGFPRPYHQFAKLNYAKPNLAKLADNSASVITCYVGLHHFPENKLDRFLADVRRVLKPGGHFLLVDHDAIDYNDLAMAHMAHTVFNAVTGVSLEEEMTEVRNFGDMNHWSRCLARHNLGAEVSRSHVEMIRQGDPSRNQMMSFVKPSLEPAVKIQPVVLPEVVVDSRSDVQPKVVWRETKNVLPTIFSKRKVSNNFGTFVETVEEEKKYSM